MCNQEIVPRSFERRVLFFAPRWDWTGGAKKQCMLCLSYSHTRERTYGLIGFRNECISLLHIDLLSRMFSVRYLFSHWFIHSFASNVE